MIKSDFLDTANNLYEEAFSANACWLLLQQYHKNSQAYQDEMQCSPAFYSVIYHALIDSLFLSLSKLYDWNKNSLTLHTLIKDINDLAETDLDADIRKKYIFLDGHFQHTITPVEEQYFKEEIDDHRKILAVLSLEYYPKTIELTLSQFINLYQQRFEELKKQSVIRNLITLRNKILAHNDKPTFFKHDALWKEYPLSDNNIETLLEFALDFLSFCIGMLTGIQKATECVNIDDWEGTLEYVRIGRTYRDDYIKDLYSDDAQ